MAVKISFVSFAVLFFITTLRSEASISTSPETSPDLSPATSPSPSPSSSSSSSSSETTCAIEKISEQMIGIAEETKEFIRKYLKTRIVDKDKMDEKNKECLYQSFYSYEGALGIIEHAIDDLTLQRYSNVIKALKGYQSTVASTLNCAEGADLITVNPEFKGMKEWTYYSTEDVIRGIKSCRSDLLEL